jgi:hypothetical protein
MKEDKRRPPLCSDVVLTFKLGAYIYIRLRESLAEEHGKKKCERNPRSTNDYSVRLMNESKWRRKLDKTWYPCRFVVHAN